MDRLKEKAQDAVEVVRKPYLAEKVVIVNGQPGCGKTMFSPIIAALDRVELLTYAYELEYICALHYLEKIDSNAAIMMVRMLTDLKLYHMMMSREVNFRPGDLSSVFSDAHPWRYLCRLFQKGDEVIPERIRKERPILHLTTHNLIPIGEPIFAGLKNRVVFIEVVRHPLYMIKQQALNEEFLVGDVRYFMVCCRYKDRELPFYVAGWEELFIRSNPTERAIYSMEKLIRLTQERQGYLKERYNANIITVPFEQFVVNPWPYMKEFEEKIGTKVTRVTRRMMKKQRVPRAKYADGLRLKLYKRCGWQPPRANLDEQSEFEIRRQFAAERVSPEAMCVLDDLCAEYEEKYMGHRKEKGE